MNAIDISWENFHQSCHGLTLKLPKQFDKIITIARGGLIPAGMLANMLNIRYIDTICIQTYDDHHNQAMHNVIKPLYENNISRIDQRKILVVDDIADTGNTFKIIRNILPEAYYVTPYAKPLGKPHTDTYYQEFKQDDWLCFPWDKHQP